MKQDRQTTVGILLWGVLVIVGVLATFSTISANAKYVLPKRTIELSIYGCEKINENALVVLGDTLRITNNDYIAHTLKVFEEEVRIESGQVGIFYLAYDYPRIGEVKCDGLNEIFRVSLLKKEKIRTP